MLAPKNSSFKAANRADRLASTKGYLLSFFQTQSQYRFTDRWRLPGTVDQTARFLADPRMLSQWWPQFRTVSLIDAGDRDGLGCHFEATVRGFLPYELRLMFKVERVSYPSEFLVRIEGDLEGHGGGTLHQKMDHVVVDLWMDVTLRRRALRVMSFLLRPLMSRQHRYVMSAGEAAAAYCIVPSVAEVG